MAYHKSMADLYRRLKKVGYGPNFVRSIVLPDWWEDCCADVPFNRGLAELAISRHLAIPLASLRNTTDELSPAPVAGVRLKTATIGTRVAQVQPAIQVARRFASQLVRACQDLPQYAGPMTAEETRKQLLSDGDGAVDLNRLLRFCWDRGIIVAHLQHLPAGDGFRKFDGLVLFIDDRPCILLAEKHDAPAKLAFHLAHELGHLFQGHIKPGQAICDDNIERIINDEEETEADRFAMEILTGRPDPYLRPVYGRTAEKLAQAAIRIGAKNQADPGLVALIYGRCADRWGVANKALQVMNANTGAQRLIREQLAAQVDLEQLGDSDRRFVEALALPQCPVS